VRAPGVGARLHGVWRQRIDRGQRQLLQFLLRAFDLVAALVQHHALGGDAQAQRSSRSFRRRQLRARERAQGCLGSALHRQHGGQDQRLFGRLRRPLAGAVEHFLLRCVVAADVAGVGRLQTGLDE